MIHPLMAQSATPMRKLLPLSDRVCPRQRRAAQWRRFRIWSRCLFGVNSPADFSLQIAYNCFLERGVRRPVVMIVKLSCQAYRQTPTSHYASSSLGGDLGAASDNL